MRVFTMMAALALAAGLAACGSSGRSETKAAPECCSKSMALKAEMPKCCAGPESACCKASMADPSKTGECCKKAKEIMAKMPACCQKHMAGETQDCCSAK